jgi:hypothetical protein
MQHPSTPDSAARTKNGKVYSLLAIHAAVSLTCEPV